MEDLQPVKAVCETCWQIPTSSSGSSMQESMRCSYTVAICVYLVALSTPREPELKTITDGDALRAISRIGEQVLLLLLLLLLQKLRSSRCNRRNKPPTFVRITSCTP